MQASHLKGTAVRHLIYSCVITQLTFPGLPHRVRQTLLTVHTKSDLIRTALECTMPPCICQTICRIKSSPFLRNFHNTFRRGKTPINFYLVVSQACTALTSPHIFLSSLRANLSWSSVSQGSMPYRVGLTESWVNLSKCIQLRPECSQTAHLGHCCCFNLL